MVRGTGDERYCEDQLGDDRRRLHTRTRIDVVGSGGSIGGHAHPLPMLYGLLTLWLSPAFDTAGEIRVGGLVLV